MNGDLTPYDVTCGSFKLVWWKCSKNTKHEWDSRIAFRSNGENCPYCSNHRVGEDNNLFVTHHEIAKEWHPQNKLTANQVTYGSGKIVLWLCKKGHEWKDSVHHRTVSGRTCRLCKKIAEGQKLIKDFK